MSAGLFEKDLAEGEHFLRALDPKLRQTLEKEGRVLLPAQKKVDGGGLAGDIQAIALFKQSKKKTFELITRPSEQMHYLPRLKLSKPILQEAVGELTEFHLGFGLMTITYRTQHWWWPELSRIEWMLDKGYDNDVKIANGHWQLYALSPKSCVGDYSTRVDTGLPVPDSVQSYVARKDIPDALEAIQTYINSGGRYKREE